LVLGLLLLLVAADADAYGLTGSKWSTSSIPVAWYLNENGSSDLGMDATEAAVQASFDTWQAVDCCAIAFSYRGPTGQVADVERSDDSNVVSWNETNFTHGASAIAITSMWSSGRGTMSESDIECNGQYMSWDTRGSGGNVDTQSILTHEIGHFLGLGDLYDGAHSSSTMYGIYSGGTGSRSLAEDDMAGCRAIYPDACGGCTVDTECPSGYHCDASACIPNTTSGVLCSPCSSPSDCTEGLCLSGGFIDGGTYCGRNCTSGADCPAGYDCAPVTSGSSQCAPTSRDCSATTPECTTDSNCPRGYRCSGGTCVRIDPEPDCTVDTDCPAGRVCQSGECVTPPPTLHGFGEPCAVGADCGSGQCLDGYCTQSCQPDEPLTGCPAGYYCDDVECGRGQCRRGGPGAGDTYTSCAADTDCAGAHCNFAGGSGICMVPCNASEALNACQVGETCQPLGGPMCGGCLCGAGMFGDPCVSDFDCVGGLCRSTADGEPPRCTTPCVNGACAFGASCGNILNPDGSSDMRCAATGQRLGGRCIDNNECQSGNCLAWGGQRFCTRACGGMCDCPAGLSCVAAIGVSICAPNTLVEGDGCGCRAPGAPSPSGLAGLLGLALVLGFRAWRRRG
jgi:MYXO-CTERM domain-containing protein